VTVKVQSHSFPPSSSRWGAVQLLGEQTLQKIVCLLVLSLLFKVLNSDGEHPCINPTSGKPMQKWLRLSSRYHVFWTLFSTWVMWVYGFMTFRHCKERLINHIWLVDGKDMTNHIVDILSSHYCWYGLGPIPLLQGKPGTETTTSIVAYCMSIKWENNLLWASWGVVMLVNKVRKWQQQAKGVYIHVCPASIASSFPIGSCVNTTSFKLWCFV